MNIWDVVILLVIAGLVALAIRLFRRGGSRGCRDCCGCPHPCKKPGNEEKQ